MGISNYLTGIMLILMGWKARSLALVVMGVIPAAYASSQAAWGGTTMTMVYLAVCVVTFIAGIIVTQNKKKKVLATNPQ